MGWGPSADFKGDIWIMKKSHATPEFVTSSLSEIHFARLKIKIADTKEREPGLKECGVFQFDGDIGQAKAFKVPKVVQSLTELNFQAFKHHRKLSLIFQANDTGQTHKKIKVI